MSTATITTEAETVARAETVLARTDAWLEANQSGNAQNVRDFQQLLRDNLDIRERLLLPPGHPDYEHPNNAYCDLGVQDNAPEIAVERITEAIGYGTAALLLVVGEQCGPEAAEFVSGDSKGDSDD